MSNHVDNGGLNGLWDLSLVQCRALQGSADEGCCGRGPTPLERLDSKSPRLERLDSKSPRLERLDSKSPRLAIPGMREKARVGRPGSCHVPATRLSV